MDMTLTFDEATRRRYDENGFLHVSLCHLTKEQVAPYYGYEIPGWEQLGLEPSRVYHGYRPASELAKAVPTFNGLPLLAEHVKDSAEDPQKALRIGNLGTTAMWNAPYLDNSLIIQDQSAIDALNPTQGGQPAKRELSASYRYDPVMEPGFFGGEPYDFVMTNIRGNHVALVKEGRAGADVVVADARSVATNPTGDSMTEPIVKQVGNLVEALVGAPEAVAEPAPVAVEAVPEAAAAVAPVAEDLCPQSDSEVGTAPAEPAADVEGAGNPADKVRAYLDAMEDQELAAKVREVLAAALGVEPPAEGQAEAPAGDAEEPAVPAAAEPEAQEDAAPAMDSAVAMDAMVAKAVASAKAALRAQFEAAREVRNLAGELDPLSYDSAAQIYRDALKVSGTPTDVQDVNALREMCRLAEKAKFAGAIYPAVAEALATDAKSTAEVDPLFAHLDTIRKA